MRPKLDLLAFTSWNACVFLASLHSHVVGWFPSVTEAFLNSSPALRVRVLTTAQRLPELSLHFARFWASFAPHGQSTAKLGGAS